MSNRPARITQSEIERSIRAAIRAARKEGVHNVEVKYLTPEHQPEPTCLYRHFDKDGQLLYVGISRDVWRRQSDHRNKSHWYDCVANVETEHYPSRYAAIAAELAAIRNEKPLHNITGRAA